MFLFNFFCIRLLSTEHIIELKCDPFVVKYMLMFSSTYKTFTWIFPYITAAHWAQFSVNWNHSLLIINVHRWFIRFAYFITSLSFLFEFTDRSVPKTLTIIFQCGPTVNDVWMCMRSEHCCGPASKHEFPSSTWFKRDRSSLRNIKWWPEMRFNTGSFTVVTESTEGTGDKWKELFTRGLLRNQFFLFFRR